MTLLGREVVARDRFYFATSFNANAHPRVNAKLRTNWLYVFFVFLKAIN
jgi:hypothetical protein